MVNIPAALKWRIPALALGLVLALGVLTPVSLALFAPPPIFSDDTPGGPYHSDGMFTPPGDAYGFLPAEAEPDGATYRWSTSHSTVTFPYAGNVGRYAHITIRLAAKRQQSDPPAHVTISLNNAQVSSLSLTGGYQVIDATLDTEQTPNAYIYPSHVQIDINSSTFSTANDPRQRGVAVDWIRLQPQRSAGEIAVEAAIWLALLLLVMLIAASRLNMTWAVAYAVGALATFTILHLSYMPSAIPATAEIALGGLAWALAALLAPKSRPVWGLGLAGCLLWVLVAGRLIGDFQIDDAYISYRYAWNLAHGNGLVYNPGEVVEGYTNFLWTLISAWAIAFGLHPAGITLGANVGLGQGLIALTYYLGTKLSRQMHIWPLFAAGLLAVDAGLITYASRGSGMEAMLFATLTLAGITLLWLDSDARAPVWRLLGGVALALASLTRPEGLLVAALLLSVRAWQDHRAGRRAWRLAGAALLPYILVVVPYQAWRIGFYGYLLPNTFYTKTGATLAIVMRGLEYCWAFCIEHWLITALLLAGLLTWALNWYSSRSNRANRAGTASRDKVEHWANSLNMALVALVAGYTLYIIAVGGDVFSGWRFFVPLLAPLVLLAQESTRATLARLRQSSRLKRDFVLVLACVTAIYMALSLYIERPNGELEVATNGSTVWLERWGSSALWFRDNTPEGTWLASPAAGAVAYYSQRPVLDMLGLNDVHIGHLQVASLGSGTAGHEKEDPAYVLQRQPSYIIPSGGYFDSVLGVFQHDYAAITIHTPTGPDFKWYRRNETSQR